MAEYVDYVKPCMTNLPLDIGIPIFNQIINTPKADDRTLDALVYEIRQRIASEEENDAQNCIEERFVSL